MKKMEKMIRNCSGDILVSEPNSGMSCFVTVVSGYFQVHKLWLCFNLEALCFHYM